MFRNKLILIKSMNHLNVICNYYYFLKVNSRFQSQVCNYCHDLMQKAMIFNDIAFVSVKEYDCAIYF